MFIAKLEISRVLKKELDLLLIFKNYFEMENVKENEGIINVAEGIVIKTIGTMSYLIEQGVETNFFPNSDAAKVIIEVAKKINGSAE